VNDFFRITVGASATCRHSLEAIPSEDEGIEAVITGAYVGGVNRRDRLIPAAACASSRPAIRRPS